MKRLVWLTLLAIFLVVAWTPVVAHASSSLKPDKSTLNLVIGTSGDSITIYYSGTTNVPSGAASCEVLNVYTSDDFGLSPEVTSKNCFVSSGLVTVTITFKGAYNGKEGTYRPVTGVSVRFYDVNGTEIGSDYLTADPIEINSISMSVSVSSVDYSSLHYTYQPESPSVGQTIRIFTVGTVTLSIQLSSPPDVSTNVLLQISQPSGFTDSKTVFIQADQAYATVSFDADVSTYINYKITSADGSITIAQGQIEMSDVDADNVILVVQQPYASGGVGDSDKVTVYAPVYVSKLSSGSITVTVNVNGVSESQTVSDTGLYTIKVPDVPAGTLYGRYSIVYNSRYGSVSFDVDFTGTSAVETTGGVITNIFYYTFMVILAASFTATIAGFFLRRPDLMSSGLMGMASSVLVFMVPTLMSYVVRLLIQSGFQQPEGINFGDLTMFNIGEKVDQSIQWTVNKAISYALSLRTIGLTLLGLLGALAALAAGVGLVGWLTAGALSQFVGKVAGEFGAQLIMLSMYSLFASYLLEVMARIYPLILNAILVIMFFSVLLYAMFASFTGNIGQVYGPIVQFSILILTIMLVPLMLSSVDAIQNEYGTIHMPDPINKVIDSIPNPFFWIATTLIQIAILVMIMYMAFNRLVAILSGGGG